MMAYFSNGTEHRDWEAENCELCVYMQEECGCPVINAHFDPPPEWRDGPDNVLDKMIPLTPDGIFNEACLFLRKSLRKNWRETDGQAPRPPRQTELHIRGD